MQPGDTLKPGDEKSEDRDDSVPTHQEPELPELPPVPGESVEPKQEEPAEEPESKDTNWHFSPDEEVSSAAPADLPAPAEVSWTASEYVAHDKDPGWYIMVVFASLVIAAIIYLITRDLVSPIVVGILGIAFAAFGARKPQVLEYHIDNSGVHIGPKVYQYGLFKTFSVLEEDATRSILLMPMQRFNLPITIYYDPKDEDRIVAALGAHLPHEDRKPAAIDNFMRKIHF